MLICDVPLCLAVRASKKHIAHQIVHSRCLLSLCDLGTRGILICSRDGPGNGNAILKPDRLMQRRGKQHTQFDLNMHCHHYCKATTTAKPPLLQLPQATSFFCKSPLQRHHYCNYRKPTLLQVQRTTASHQYCRAPMKSFELQHHVLNAFPARSKRNLELYICSCCGESHIP